jgi:hypothetical protein
MVVTALYCHQMPIKYEDLTVSMLRYFFKTATGHYSIGVDQRWSPVADNMAKLIREGACGAIQESNGTVGPQIFEGCDQYVGDPPIPVSSVFLNAGTNTSQEITGPLRCLINDINSMCKDNVTGYVILGFFALIAVAGLAAFAYSRYKSHNSRSHLPSNENKGEERQNANYGAPSETVPMLP